MSFDSPILFAAMISSGLVLLVWAVAGSRSERPARTQGPGADLRLIQLQEGIGRRAVSPSIRWFSLRARRLTPIGMIERLDRRTQLAGIQDSFPLERALAAKFIVFIVGIVTWLLLWRLAGWFWTGLAIAVASYFIVDLVVWSRARERQDQIEKDLPDTMDQLTVSVESGMAFEGAMERSTHHEGPLAEELARTLTEMQLGMSRRDALQNMVNRTDVPDLRRFVSAMSHAEAFGVPIAQVLRTQSEDLRDKRRQRAREKAQRIPVLLAFPLIFFIFPAILVVLIGPALIRIFEQLLGTPVP